MNYNLYVSIRSVAHNILLLVFTQQARLVKGLFKGSDQYAYFLNYRFTTQCF